MVSDKNTSLDLKTSLLVFVGFCLVLGFLIWGGFIWSDQRKQAVYDRYAQETDIYIENNRPGLIELFTRIFPDSRCSNYSEQNIKLCPTQDEVARTVPDTLKDWSSTEFIKKSGQSILVMRLSGETSTFYGYSDNREQQLAKLLNGELSSIPWDDYTGSFSHKEVIIPVKDTSGRILGAIVRGVIE